MPVRCASVFISANLSQSDEFREASMTTLAQRSVRRGDDPLPLERDVDPVLNAPAQSLLGGPDRSPKLVDSRDVALCSAFP